MNESLWQLWEFAELLAPSLITAAAVGVAAAVLGVFVLLRREALAALALPQAVAVGAAAGFRLSGIVLPAFVADHIGWPTLPPALLAAAATVLLLGWSRCYRPRRCLELIARLSRAPHECPGDCMRAGGPNPC